MDTHQRIALHRDVWGGAKACALWVALVTCILFAGMAFGLVIAGVGALADAI